MASLNVAFWNVQNLFEPGVVARGPQSPGELDEKLDVLSGVINAFFGGEGPDVLGLAEVSTKRIFLDLVRRLNHRFLHVWEDAGISDQTGLALLARESRFVDVTVLDTQRPSVAARPRSVIVRCELAGTPEPFLVVVNHWKSRLGTPAIHNADRLQTADWLGDYLANKSSEQCVLVLGDFNAEPFEPPFGELRLRGRRTFNGALWSNATPAYLYNTAWKIVTEPESWEVACQPGYVESRPKTTHGDAGTNVFDQLLVSGRALRNGPLTLREQTVDLFRNPKTLKQSATGVLRPRKWVYVSPNEHDGSSDHFPLLATFTVN
jgi:endonuclease/exonuclease/phosphatase family metal-dependent hydrolase